MTPEHQPEPMVELIDIDAAIHGRFETYWVPRSVMEGPSSVELLGLSET